MDGWSGHCFLFDYVCLIFLVIFVRAAPKRSRSLPQSFEEEEKDSSYQDASPEFSVEFASLEQKQVKGPRTGSFCLFSSLFRTS